jgi:transposase-like protein
VGQLLHGSARTTPALRRTIQHSRDSIARLAARYDLNAKAVAKWRKRTDVEDAPRGPRHPHPTVLTAEQEAVIVAFRKRTLLALDDCLYALQAGIPLLTRPSLHRCLQRHGISRLPEVEGDKPAKKEFAKYAIGYFHLDIAEVHTEQGRLYLSVAIDRTSKFAYAELHPDQTRTTACRFLRRLIAVVPYRIHTILTDDGIQFTNQ